MVGREGKRPAFERARGTFTLLVALALVLIAGGCGGGSEKDDINLVIGSRGTPEEEILGQIYVQALEGAGYNVKGEPDIRTDYRSAPLEEINRERISGYPDHVDAALEDIFYVDEPPRDPEKALELLNSKITKDGLTAFSPTPYSLSRPVVVLKTTAEKHGLKTFSDLKGKSETMTLYGPTDCHLSPDCLGGIEQHYGAYFESITYMRTKKAIDGRYKALEDGDYDATISYNTDGRLIAEDDKFVALEEDKHAFPAGNVVFITRSKLAERAGPDFESAILEAQEGLTLPVIQQLAVEVEVEGKDPATVAAAYLSQLGLIDD